MDYERLNRTISIVFLDYEMEKIKELPTHTKWQILNSENGRTLLTEDLELHIIEIPKIKRMLETGKLKKWILFLENPDGEETKKMAENEEEIKEAIETLEEISSDEEKERIAELRLKYIMDKKSETRTAREIGLKQGLEEGRKEGRKKGIEEGRKEANIEIAKKLKKKGMKTKEIAEITELSEETVSKL